VDLQEVYYLRLENMSLLLIHHLIRQPFLLRHHPQMLLLRILSYYQMMGTPHQRLLKLEKSKQ
jgi:hypothetical protein